jgi:hypothetical protein
VPGVSFAALLAAAGAAAVDVFYLLLINDQDEGGVGSSRVLFVAACIGAAAVLLAIGAVVPNAWARLLLRGPAAFMLLAWTFLGVFSIGILLLVPAILALRSTVQAATELRPLEAWPVVAMAAIADVAVVAFGLAGTA